jgi:hypothetical protein
MRRTTVAAITSPIFIHTGSACAIGLAAGTIHAIYWATEITI